MNFILDVLKPGVDSKETLERLLADEDTRNLILDDEALLHAILERRSCLKISSHFYFYILVRHVFMRSGMSDRGVADYVAELLSEFSNTDRIQQGPDGQGRPLKYVCDMMAALQTADDATRFYLRAYIGNYTLFLSGIFPDHIRFRTERRGAPNLAYYEAMGQSNYRAASDHHLARKYALDGIYQTLAERFTDTRLALNDLGERMVSLNDPDYSASLAQLFPSN